MTPEQLLARCPSLWHVAPAGAWEAIQEEGFRTAAQLIDAADLEDEARQALHETPREGSTRLTVEGREVALRDQEALLRGNLVDRLEEGTTIGDWVRLLNRRVYLFTDRTVMEKALARYVARDGAHDVIAFSPRRLVGIAGGRIELARQSSGAVARKTDPPKGSATFMSIARFPDRRPAEVTLLDGLDDLSAVTRVQRIEPEPAPEPAPEAEA